MNSLRELIHSSRDCVDGESEILFNSLDGSKNITLVRLRPPVMLEVVGVTKDIIRKCTIEKKQLVNLKEGKKK